MLALLLWVEVLDSRARRSVGGNLLARRSESLCVSWCCMSSSYFDSSMDSCLRAIVPSFAHAYRFGRDAY